MRIIMIGKYKRGYKLADIDYQYSVPERKAKASQPRFLKQKNNRYIQRSQGNSGATCILCGGDLMCEPGMSEACCFEGVYDFRPCFRFVKPILEKADFTIANLETIVCDRIPYAYEKVG